MSPTNPELRQFINQFFSDDELETLCFDYFPEAMNEFGGGMSKNRKVIALIGHCERRGRLDDLRAAVARERAAAWKRQFATDVAIQKPSFSEETRFLNERDPRQIFLSHATADAEFAHTLAADLRAEGWRVWIAPESIRPGEKWVEAIDRGLETSGVFVVVLTPAAVASRWVNTETDAAVEMQHESLITFIPLDVAECRPKRLWRQYQYISFRNSYEVGLDALLRRLDGDEAIPAPPTAVNEREPVPAKPKTDPNRRIDEKTGIELIRIPAGPFLYGSTDVDTKARDNEKPQRMIDLPEYWIGRYPVTNEQFARFVAATGHKTTAEREGFGWAWTGSNWDQIKHAYWRHPGGPKTTIEGKDNHPVVQVSWDDAQAFCDWAGLALPSEEEWEKAARGSDGRVWPWGNEAPTDQHGNFNGNVGATTPVGEYSPKGDSPYGCADMAGNVWEWTDSWYDATAARRVLRGGSWHGSQYLARAAYRLNLHPINRRGSVGCRLVRRPPSQAL
jgi:formylglycine-generating enzyme required for sulfatase activity